MSSKTSSFRIRTAMNKRPWAVALSFIAFFFALPIYTAIGLQDLSGWRKVAEGLPNGRADVVKMLEEILSINNIPVIVIICISSFVAALAFLSYMNNRKQVDFYHSMPTSREKMFVVHSVSGLFSVLLPYLINLGLAVCVVFALGMGELLDWQLVAQGFGLTALFFAAMFAVTAFACVLCGNTVMAGLLSVFILGMVPLGSVLVRFFIEIFYPTYYTACYDWNIIIVWGSPLTRYIANAIGYEPIGGSALMIAGVITLMLFLLTMLLYKKRPSEGAGHAIAFPKAESFVKYPVVLLFTLGFAILFHMIGDNNDGYTWLIFGAMAGALLSSQIGEIIFNGDFRAYKKHPLGVGIFACLILAVIICAANDVTGYNRYVPRANDIVQINIKMNGVNNFAYDDYLGNYYDYGLGQYQSVLAVEEIDRLEQGPIIDEEGINAALSLVDKFINAAADAAVEDDKDQTDVAAYPAYEQYIQTATYSILYTMADGSRIARQYIANSLPIGDIYEELCTIYNNPLFRDAQYAAFDHDPANIRISSVYSFEAMDDMYYGNKFGGDFLAYDCTQDAAVLAAFEQDLKQLTPQYMSDNMPVGMITISVYEKDINGLSEKELQDMVYRCYDYPIFADFDATLIALEQLGYDQDYWILNPAEVRKVIINKYDEDWNSTQTEFTDAADINEILDQTHNSEASYYNSFVNTDQYHTATVLYKESAEWRSTTRNYAYVD